MLWTLLHQYFINTLSLSSALHVRYVTAAYFSEMWLRFFSYFYDAFRESFLYDRQLAERSRFSWTYRRYWDSQLSSAFLAGPARLSLTGIYHFPNEKASVALWCREVQLDGSFFFFFPSEKTKQVKAVLASSRLSESKLSLPCSVLLLWSESREDRGRWQDGRKCPAEKNNVKTVN